MIGSSMSNSPCWHQLTFSQPATQLTKTRYEQIES